MTEAEERTGANPAGALRGAWRHRQFRLLIASFAVSGSGDWIYSVALIAYVLDQTGSPGWVAVATILKIAPYALLGPLAGAIADRFDRRRLMLVLDLMRFVLMLAMAAVAALDGSAGLVIVLTVALSVATTPYRPAVAASTPRVVGEPDLAAANAVEGIVNQLNWFVGPAVGAILLAASSAGAAFAVNAFAFLASAALVAGVRDAGGGPGEPGVDESEVAAPRLMGQLVAGFSVIRRSSDLLLLTAVLMFVVLAYGFELVLWVLVADERLGLGAEGVGYLTAAVGIGGLLAAPFTGRLAGGRHPGAVLAVSVFLLGAPLASLSVITSSVVAIAVLLGEGLGNIAFEVLFVTLVQRLVRRDLLGRVFGIHDALSAVATLAGAAMAPFVVATAGLQPTLILAGGMLVVFSVVAFAPLARLDARSEARRRQLRPIVEVLDRLALLDGAGLPVLERLAAAVVEEPVPAGTAVVTEGEPADDLFVVRSGRFSVMASGESGGPPVAVNTLGPDDWFGEIGLVARLARTATVVADEPGVIWRIDGPTFLDAVESGSPLSMGLRQGLVGRLNRTHPLAAADVAPLIDRPPDRRSRS